MRRADVDEAERIVLIRNRKHPTDRDRVDESPLMPAHSLWPRWDALEIIKAQPKGELVFPYQGDTVGERFEKACEVAKLDGVVFHLLRHESLSRYAELRRFDLLRLQLIGGHRDIRHLTRYAKLSARVGEGSRTASGGSGPSGQANGRTSRRPGLISVRKPARSTTHKRKVDSAAPQRLTFKAKGFAEEVRRSFIREYRNRWQGSHIIPSAESRDADLFLRRLEGLASTHASSQAEQVALPAEQERAAQCARQEAGQSRR